jgi:hypothetical protein
MLKWTELTVAYGRNSWLLKDKLLWLLQCFNIVLFKISYPVFLIYACKMFVNFYSMSVMRKIVILPIKVSATKF